MDTDKLNKLISLLKDNELGEIEFTEDKCTIRVTAFGHGGGVVTQAAPQTHPVAVSTPVTAAPVTAPIAVDRSKQVRSPFVGTFYESSSPGSPPFVSVGSRVKKGDTLCIIEAMKIMNEIESDRDGVIKEILAKNGLAVEYDQVVFVLE